MGVQNVALDAAGNVSFDFKPIVYPRSYVSPFKFVHDNGDPRMCDQCSFRPWAAACGEDRDGDGTPRQRTTQTLRRRCRAGAEGGDAVAAGRRASIAPADCATTTADQSRQHCARFR